MRWNLCLGDVAGMEKQIVMQGQTLVGLVENVSHVDLEVHGIKEEMREIKQLLLQVLQSKACARSRE